MAPVPIFSLYTNALCGIDQYEMGTYTDEGIAKLCDMLKVNVTLFSLRCASNCQIRDSSVATDDILPLPHGSIANNFICTGCKIDRRITAVRSAEKKSRIRDSSV